MAAKVLRANQGTRDVPIVFDGWDHHQDVYSTSNNGRLARMANALDDALSALLDDLKATGLFEETLLAMAGELGRTVGPLSPQAGRGFEYVPRSRDDIYGPFHELSS